MLHHLVKSRFLRRLTWGDFYAASQLDLEDVNFDSANKTLSVSVPSIAGVACKIRFIVTKKGVPAQPLSYVDIPANERRKWHSRRVAIYDDRIGETAKLVAGGKGERLEASYKLKDDDLYVRARIESDWPGQFAGRRSLHPHNRTRMLCTGADRRGTDLCCQRSLRNEHRNR